MTVTPIQLLLIEKGIIEIYNQAKEKGFNNLIELKINNAIKVGYLPYSIKEAKDYLEKKFYSHPALKSKTVDDMFSYVTSSNSDEPELSETEHNQIAGIQEIVKRKGYLEGLKHVIAALVKLPTSTNLYLLKAEVLSKTNKLEEAIEVYSKIIQLDPSNVNAYANRGATKATLNRIVEAEIDYSLALQINNRLPIVLCNRGSIYIKLKRYKKALNDYNDAIAIDPSLARAYFERGSLRVAYLNEFDIGLADITKAAELGHPTALDALLGLNGNQ